MQQPPTSVQRALITHRVLALLVLHTPVALSSSSFSGGPVALISGVVLRVRLVRGPLGTHFYTLDRTENRIEGRQCPPRLCRGEINYSLASFVYLLHSHSFRFFIFIFIFQWCFATRSLPGDWRERDCRSLHSPQAPPLGYAQCNPSTSILVRAGHAPTLPRPP